MNNKSSQFSHLHNLKNVSIHFYINYIKYNFKLINALDTIILKYFLIRY